MSGTSALDKKLTDMLTGAAAYSPPTLYLALLGADPGKAGSQVSEIDDASYARQSLAGKMGEADAVTGESVNIVTITFPAGSVPWVVTCLALADAVSGGELQISGFPSVPKTIPAGVPFQLAPGQVRLRTN